MSDDKHWFEASPQKERKEARESHQQVDKVEEEEKKEIKEDLDDEHETADEIEEEVKEEVKDDLQGEKWKKLEEWDKMITVDPAAPEAEDETEEEQTETKEEVEQQQNLSKEEMNAIGNLMDSVATKIKNSKRLQKRWRKLSDKDKQTLFKAGATRRQMAFKWASMTSFWRIADIIRYKKPYLKVTWVFLAPFVRSMAQLWSFDIPGKSKEDIIKSIKTDGKTVKIMLKILKRWAKIFAPEAMVQIEAADKIISKVSDTQTKEMLKKRGAKPDKGSKAGKAVETMIGNLVDKAAA